MTDAEWQTRCDLAALYRVVDHLGWTDLVNTHMSARVHDQSDTFLINRYAEMFDEITASSLVKMDLDGNVIGGGKFNSADFMIRSGVYKARPNTGCVTHTHTVPAPACRCCSMGFARLARMRCRFSTRLPITPMACRRRPKNARRSAVAATRTAASCC
jgi:ribulose-5-phosphate 4-epimerase/fuculose-1-phosphate aldolase